MLMEVSRLQAANRDAGRAPGLPPVGWSEVAQRVMLKHKTTKTAENCRQTFANMKRQYVMIKDAQKRTGSAGPSQTAFDKHAPKIHTSPEMFDSFDKHFGKGAILAEPALLLSSPPHRVDQELRDEDTPNASCAARLEWAEALDVHSDTSRAGSRAGSSADQSVVTRQRIKGPEQAIGAMNRRRC